MKKTRKNYLFLIIALGLISMGINASGDASGDTTKVKENITEVEEVEEYIKNIIKDFSQFEGFFETYQDPETSDIYFVINKDQLNKWMKIYPEGTYQIN